VVVVVGYGCSCGLGLGLGLYLSVRQLLMCCLGPKHGRRATWVGASSDETFVRIDESLINIHTLSNSSIVANQSCIGLSCLMF